MHSLTSASIARMYKMTEVIFHGESTGVKIFTKKTSKTTNMANKNKHKTTYALVV